MASASASATVIEDLNVWDANNVKHANRGEDFNVDFNTSALAGNTLDVNSDYNYLIVLRYTPPGSTSNIYVDLNAQITGDAWDGRAGGTNFHEGKVDANVVSITLSTTGGSETPCASGGDYNVIELGPNDYNSFNATVSVPTLTDTCTTCGDMNKLIGREVTVELWPLTQVAGQARTATCGDAPDANAPFIIGPAIIVVTPNVSHKVAKIDQQITVIGFGFGVSSGYGMDNNVDIMIFDANLTELSARNSLVKDVNIKDVIHTHLYKYHRVSSSSDTNDAVISLMGDGNITSDWNGITVHPDANGEFDVNIAIPYVSDTAGGTIGRTDFNVVRAFSKKSEDANADKFIIAPKITEPAWLDVNILIGNITYSLDDAISQNLISNYGAVSNYQVRMGFRISTDGNKSVMLKFNDDVNLRKGPTRNYGTDMNARVFGVGDLGIGDVEINTTNMPEFAIDTNIYMYYVPTPSSEMPFITKDGISCPTNMCKNQDGTNLSQTKTAPVTGVRTWYYSAVTKDGNFAFRTSSFTKYELTTLTVTVVTPNGSEKIRTPRHNADTNYTITFTFRDLNVHDNNMDAVGGNSGNRMGAVIYYSDQNGSGRKLDTNGIIVSDINLYDSIGIRCNGYNNFTYSGNTAGSVDPSQEQTCVYDMTRSDLNRIIGEYQIDVNVMGPFGRDDGFVGRTALDHTDANVFFNPPLIEIVDVNLNSENFSIDDWKNAVKYSNANFDINYLIDFNIYIPDTNIDSNLSLSDINIHFYLSQTTQGGLTDDLNIGGSASMFDQNFVVKGAGDWIAIGGFYMKCTEPKNKAMDYNCMAEFDTNGVLEGKYYLDAVIFNNITHSVFNKNENSTLKRVIDVNELWDINSSTYSFSVNDGNAPMASFSPSSVTVSGSSYTATLTCDDNTSGDWKYFFKRGTGSWSDKGTNDQYALSAPTSEAVTYTLYGGCIDYAKNTSDMNATMTITLQPSVTGQAPGAGPGGGAGGLPAAPTFTAGTETILEKTISKKPTAEEITAILTEAGASQNAIEKAGEAVGKTTVSRAITVEKTTDEEGNVTYKTTMQIIVRNKGAKSLRNVKVVENIPKSVVASASELGSPQEFKVLKEDPIIEFTIASIAPTSSKTISYSVDAKVTESAADAWTDVPITADLQEVAPCEGVTCPDELCKTGACNPGTEMCEYTSKANGTSCGANMECQAGECVAAAPAPPTPPADYTTWIVIVIVVVLAAGGGYYYYTKYHAKGKPMGKQ